MDSDLFDTLRNLLREPKSSTSLPIPLRNQLIQQGVLTELLRDGSQASITTLVETIIDHPVQAVSDLAWEFLQELAGHGSPAAQDAVCSLAIEYDHGVAHQLALTQGYLPLDLDRQALFYLLTNQIEALYHADPEMSRLTHAYHQAGPALRKRALAAARQAGIDEWENVVRAAVDDEPPAWDALVTRLPLFHLEAVRELARQLVDELARQGHNRATQAIFRLYIEKEYLPARDLALASGILPIDPVDRALFLFLTGQWERYEGLDFDQSYLTTAYEVANPSLRRRIIATTRRSGRLDWLQALSSGRRIRWLGDMTEGDWEAVSQLLLSEEKYADLWRLAQSASPFWSARFLNALQSRGWIPTPANEVQGYHQLSELAGRCAGQEIHLRPPKSLKGVFRNLNCLALSADGRRAACGAAEGSVQIWQLPEKFPQQIIPSPAGQAWTLDFSPNGEYLVGGYGDHSVRIWRVDDGRLVKTLEGHQSTVRSLAVSPDGRQLVSGGFDGAVKLWRFPFGPELRSLDGHTAEVFCTAFSPTGQMLASGGADASLRLWSPETGQLIRGWAAHTGTITAAVFTQDGGLLATGSRDHTVQLWSLPEGSLVQTIREHQTMITALTIQPAGRILASASLDGQIALWSLPDGQRILSYQAHSDAIAGMHFFPDGESLISAGSEGSVSIWDLKPLLYLRLPADRVSLPDIQRIQEILDEQSLPEADRWWFEFTLALSRWRRRFDIALGEVHHIQVGEYDIELG